MINRKAIDFMIEKLNKELKGLGLVISESVAEYGDNSRYLEELGGIGVKGVYVAGVDRLYSIMAYEGPSWVVEGLKKIAENNNLSLRYRLTGKHFTETFAMFKKDGETKGHIIHGDYVITDPIMGMLKYTNKKV